MRQILWCSILAAGLATVASAHGRDCSSLLGSCDYYGCVAESLHCEPQALLKTTAHPFCLRYQEHDARFSDHGRLVLHEIKSCLQEQIETTHPRTCEDADQAFADAHVTCYREAGFCSLGLRDKMQVFRIGWSALKHPKLRHAAGQIRRDCRSSHSTPSENL